jgi:hypothetical protein
MTSKTISPRRAKSRFRFDKNRDDLLSRVQTVRVFTTSSPLLDSADPGVFGCPVVSLSGYVKVEGANKLNSVRRMDGAGGFIVGRAVEVSRDELARLDAFAELTGNYHRFLTRARGPQTGMDFDVWVYQLLEDAGPAELALSALAEKKRPKAIAA